MTSLKEVEQAIWSTECAAFLREGLYRSMPVFAQDADGLVDVFFTYGRNREATEFAAPLVTFGICFDAGKTAFVRVNDAPTVAKCDVPGPQAHPEQTVGKYRELEDLYPLVRECAFGVCDNGGKEAAIAYCDLLEETAGPVLWEQYKASSPEFFRWVDSLG